MLNLTKLEAVELLAFFFEVGYVSYEHHESVHDLIWRLKVEMDQWFPGWTPKDLRRIAKELREESK